MKNKKGFITTGLATIFLYFGVAFLIVAFFFIFKLSKGDTTVKIDSYVLDTDKNYRLLNFLRTPIEIDGAKMNMVDLIAIYRLDSSKKDILEQNLNKFIENYNGAKCSVICIDGEKFSTGCGNRINACPLDSIKIPGYTKPIEVAFNPDTAALSYTDIRVGRPPE